MSPDIKCEKCGHTKFEHHHGGACYGVCGEFVPTPDAGDAGGEIDESALAAIQRPEFWCRARVFLALRAASESGVLCEAFSEIDGLPGESCSAIEDHLREHWTKPAAVSHRPPADAAAPQTSGATCKHGWRGHPPENGDKIVTPCPSCGMRTLFIGTGGHLTCGNLGPECREPSVERQIELLKAAAPRTPAAPSAAVTEQEKRNTWIIPAAEEIISRIRQGTGLGIAFSTVCGIIAKHHATYLAKSPAPTPAATEPTPTPERIAGEQDIEGIAARVHEDWMDAKRNSGVTSRLSESGEDLMVPYAQLSDAAKELDRATVRCVLNAMKGWAER